MERASSTTAPAAARPRPPASSCAPAAAASRSTAATSTSYFPSDVLQMVVRQPLVLTETAEKFDIVATVEGGGIAGQAGADPPRHQPRAARVRHRAARAAEERGPPDPRPAQEGAQEVRSAPAPASASSSASAERVRVSRPGDQGESFVVEITMQELLEAGVHFGHQTRRWNPKMKPYIFGERNGIYIIDLAKTLQHVPRGRRVRRPGWAARAGGCCSSAPSGRRRRSVARGGAALRPVLRDPPLAGRHADQLRDHPRSRSSGCSRSRRGWPTTAACTPRRSGCGSTASASG